MISQASSVYHVDEVDRVLLLDSFLSYDTTFQQGDSKSPQERPCIPALFLIHEQKFGIQEV